MNAALKTGLIGAVLMTAAPAFANIVDQQNFDVRLVAAQISTDLVTIGEGNALIPLTSCKETERYPEWHSGVRIYDNALFDCTQAVADFLRVPVLKPVKFSTAMRIDSLEMLYPGIAKTARRVDVFTATRDAALAPATGVGFFFQFQDTFVPKDNLVQFTRATDFNGEAVTVLRFAALFDGSAFESIAVKPYIRYVDGDTLYHNWEDNRVRGINGNYYLRANDGETLRFTDVIREMDRIPVVPSIPQTRLEQQFLATDVVTLTHSPGKVEAEVALFPYVHSVDLQWNPATLQVEAGKEVWFRFVDPATSGQPVRLYYKTSASPEEQQAGDMHGGNCFGQSMRCFKIVVPADASGQIIYRFDTSPTTYSFTVAGTLVASAKITANGVELNGRPQAGQALRLQYSAERIVKLAREARLVPEYVGIDGILTDQDGHTTRIPLGRISAWRDGDFQLVFQARMAELSILLPAGAQTLKLTIEASLSVHGQTIATLVDDGGDVGLWLL